MCSIYLSLFSKHSNKYIFEIGLHLFYEIDKANQIYYSSAKTDKINYKIYFFNFEYMYHKRTTITFLSNLKKKNERPPNTCTYMHIT